MQPKHYGCYKRYEARYNSGDEGFEAQAIYSRWYEDSKLLIFKKVTKIQELIRVVTGVTRILETYWLNKCGKIDTCRFGNKYMGEDKNCNHVCFKKKLAL